MPTGNGLLVLDKIVAVINSLHSDFLLLIKVEKLLMVLKVLLFSITMVTT